MLVHMMKFSFSFIEYYQLPAKPTKAMPVLLFDVEED